MKINKESSLPLDKFIEFALYDKDTGIVHQMDEDFEIAQTEATDEGDF